MEQLGGGPFSNAMIRGDGVTTTVTVCLDGSGHGEVSQDVSLA